jgi:hypothetical protein
MVAASPAEQKYAVTWSAALSAGVDGGLTADTFAVSVWQAASESAATKRTPDESASQRSRHWPGNPTSVESAPTTSVHLVAVVKVRLVEPSTQRK